MVIAPETLITNCHVLAKATRFSVVHDDTVLQGKLTMWDTERDLCQVQAATLNAPAVPLANGSALLVGQNVYALGAPAGLELTLSAGLLSSLRRNASKQLESIQTSAPISHGSSGGGLFDDEGRLIGITSSGMVGSGVQNLNFAIPADFLRELPQRHQAAAERSKQGKGVAALPPAASAPAAAVVAATPASVPVAPQVIVATLAPARGLTLADHVPFLSDDRDAKLKSIYLKAMSPKACAISGNGHYACAWGTKVSNPQAPTDPQERALANCAKLAAEACMTYAVDDTVVYTPHTLAPTSAPALTK